MCIATRNVATSGKPTQTHLCDLEGRTSIPQRSETAITCVRNQTFQLWLPALTLTHATWSIDRCITRDPSLATKIDDWVIAGALLQELTARVTLDTNEVHTLALD